MAKPKIFVSHSTLDSAFASQLVKDLNAAGAQAWMDRNDLGAGNFQERISQALADCEWFLLVLTRSALVSDWVRQEVDAANRLKHQKRIKELIFMKAAEVDYTELPALWGVFNILDATDDYEAAFAKTLKAVGLPSSSNNQPLLSSDIKGDAPQTDTLTFEIPDLHGPSAREFDGDLARGRTLLAENRYDEAMATFEAIIDGVHARFKTIAVSARAYFALPYRMAWEGKCTALRGLGQMREAERAWAVLKIMWNGVFPPDVPT